MYQNVSEMYQNVSKMYLKCRFFLFNRPKSGSMLLYSRKKVRYRRDGYCWKKRKDGKTTREDHMKLKVQGMEVIFDEFLQTNLANINLGIVMQSCHCPCCHQALRINIKRSFYERHAKVRLTSITFSFDLSIMVKCKLA